MDPGDSWSPQWLENVLFPVRAQTTTSGFCYTPEVEQLAPQKMVVGRLLSYWEGHFSGAMLNFGRVYLKLCCCWACIYRPMFWVFWGWWFATKNHIIQVTNKKLALMLQNIPKNSGTPKSSILIGFSIINHPFGNLGVPLFWKHPPYFYIAHLSRWGAASCCLFVQGCEGSWPREKWRPWITNTNNNMAKFPKKWTI